MRQGTRDVALGMSAAISSEPGTGGAARVVVITRVGEHAPPVLFGVGADVTVCPVRLNLGQRRKLLGGGVGVNGVTGDGIAAPSIDLGSQTRGTTRAIQHSPTKITLSETEHGPVLGQRAGRRAVVKCRLRVQVLISTPVRGQRHRVEIDLTPVGVCEGQRGGQPSADHW